MIQTDKTQDKIQGYYDYTDIERKTFIVNGDLWQIKRQRESKRMYLVNLSADTYISGLFKVKHLLREKIYSFDFDGNYYFLSEDDDNEGVAIAYVNEKRKN